MAQLVQPEQGQQQVHEVEQEQGGAGAEQKTQDQPHVPGLVEEVILAGGTTINSLFLKENLVDELIITVEPLLFGKGLTLFKNLDLNIRLELIETKQLEDGVLNLKYKIIK